MPFYMKVKLYWYVVSIPQQWCIERILNPPAFHTILDSPLGLSADLNMSSHEAKPNKTTKAVLVCTVCKYLLIVTTCYFVPLTKYAY